MNTKQIDDETETLSDETNKSDHIMQLTKIISEKNDKIKQKNKKEIGYRNSKVKKERQSLYYHDKMYK